MGWGWRGGGRAVNSGLSFSPSAHKGAELCRGWSTFRVALPWGLNETSVEAEPEGENAILLFNHTDNLFSLSLPHHPHNHPNPTPHTTTTTSQHCYFSLGLVKLFILYTHFCQARNREATVNERAREGWLGSLNRGTVNFSHMLMNPHFFPVQLNSIYFISSV